MSDLGAERCPRAAFRCRRASEPKAKAEWRTLRRASRLALRRSLLATTGGIIVTFWIVCALLAPWIAPYPPNKMDSLLLVHPWPSAEHWLGVDHLGRDILSRIIWGARTVLIVAPVAVLGAATLGTILGLLAGYRGGWIDALIMRVGDTLLAFPKIILYMIIIARFGASALNIILVIAFTAAPIIARIVRARDARCQEPRLRRRRPDARREHLVHLVCRDPAKCARSVDRRPVPAARLHDRRHRRPRLSRHRPAATGSGLGRDGEGNLCHDLHLAAHDASFRRRRSHHWSSGSISSPPACRRSRAMADILALESVTIEHESRGHARSRIVHDMSLSIRPGEAFGLVGESGCGKSTIALSIMRYLPPGMTLASGRIIFQGQDQYRLTEGDLRRTRGNRVAMIYQDPMSSLNPVMTIGRQLIEVPMLHHALDGRRAWRRAVAMLEEVRLPDPESHDVALPAPTLRRPAAARRHRHGADSRAGAAHHGRAHDWLGRHH